MLATTAVAALIAGGATASPVGNVIITDVTGNWTSITGGSNTSGVGTSAISWGTTSGSQSGYSFAPTAPLPSAAYDADEVFDLGSFTHNNFPISAGTSITEATLEVVTEGTVDGTVFALTSTFIFDHFETPNNANPCAAGGPTPCGDLVTPTLNVGASESITIDDVDYFISVTGFDIGASFLTAEGASNTATLRGVFTAEVAAIPLPAAGWMLLAGLGGIAALRRRKAANA